MSRVANNPVEVPSGVEVTLGETEISVKGAKGTLAMSVTVSYTHLTLPTKVSG